MKKVLFFVVYQLFLALVLTARLQSLDQFLKNFYFIVREQEKQVWKKEKKDSKYRILKFCFSDAEAKSAQWFVNVELLPLDWSVDFFDVGTYNTVELYWSRHNQ